MLQIPGAPFVAKQFQTGSDFLLVLEATDPSVARVMDWVAQHRELLNRELIRCSSILFRGFAFESSEQFNQFTAACSDSGPVQYRERMTPRSHVSGDIWTSTDYPPNQVIFAHNENSHCTSWPLKLFFCCLVASETGGATPITDCRRVGASIPADIKAELARRKWMYVRNFHFGLGFSWQSVFEVNTKEELDVYCRENEMTAHWYDSKLVIRYVRSPVLEHPKTGEAVWFNHGTFYHPTTLEPRLYRAMSARMAHEDFTYYSCFGDGTPIPDDMVARLREAYHGATIRFPWERGDVLVLDNMLTAHGREPFTGGRKVLVGMTETVMRASVDTVST